jgi:hypothetical protein
MNRLLFILLILLCACANEVVVLDPAGTAPVVYGLLSPQDTVHRVRLTRTFIADGNLDSVAQLPDSLYFRNAEVFLELRTPKGYVIDRNKMEPIQIEDKEDGLFLTRPNMVFECRPFPSLAATYSSEIDYTITVSIPDLKISALARSRIPSIPALGLPVSMNGRNKIDLYEYQKNKVVIAHKSEEYTEFQLIFRYSEYRWDEWVDSEFVYHIKLAPREAPNTHGLPGGGGGEPPHIELDAPFLYNLVANRIKEDPQVSVRKFYNIELRIINADHDFWDYTWSFEYLTDFNEVNYSNVTNGYGLLSTYRIKTYPAYGLSWQSLDSLCRGTVTRHLNFKIW